MCLRVSARMVIASRCVGEDRQASIVRRHTMLNVVPGQARLSVGHGGAKQIDHMTDTNRYKQPTRPI
jgi:hypothetical protein